MEQFTLKAILRLTGLNPDTVRAWEKRYEAVKPNRSSSGRRLYNEQEVNRLKLLAELTINGHSISTIAKLPDQKLVSLLATLKSTPTITRHKPINSQIEQITELLIQSIEVFDLNTLEIQLSKASYTMSSKDFIFYLIPQLMLRVGNGINNGTLTIAQEHALSELIKKYIRRIYDQLEPVNGTFKKAKTLIFATPENHLHEFGVLMAAVLCRFQGFNTHYLGPNMPAASFSEAIKKIKPHAVVLGFSNNQSTSYLKEIDQNISSGIMLWLGGAVPKINHNHFKREIWVFETLEELEKKMESKY